MLTLPALALLAIVAGGPLLAERFTIPGLPPAPDSLLAWVGRLLVVLSMGLAIALSGWRWRNQEPWPFRLVLLLIIVAGMMTACHWLMVDRQPERAQWQRERYQAILAQTSDAPHQYRPLPYGFTRGPERLTGDWWFSCVSYRWFFGYWFLWSSYTFARCFLDPGRALLTLGALPLLYPFSIAYYFGQLTDPLSHALFILALVYIVEDRWLPLAGAVALGVMAKETALVLIPAHAACWWRNGLPALARTVGVALAGAAAFLVVRLPLGWRPGNADLNGLDALMIGTNLGIGEPVAHTSVPLTMNYLHPLLFIGVFLPFIALGWRRVDPRLRALFLTVPPLVLLSNLCFGWLYESRNYMPLVPLLATMAVWVALPPSSPATNLTGLEPSDTV